MKLCKISLVIFLVFCLISSAWCLKDRGISVGLTNSTHDFNTIYNIGARWEAGYKLGYNISIFIDFLKHRSLFSRLSTSFVQKGATIKIITVTLNPGEISFQNDLNYLSLALSQGIAINGKHVRPYFLLGIRYDILISKEIEVLNSFYDHYKTNVFGLSGGIGLKFKGFSLPFFAEIVYNHDMTQSQAKFSDREELQNIKNKNVDLKIGIQF